MELERSGEGVGISIEGMGGVGVGTRCMIWNGSGRRIGSEVCLGARSCSSHASKPHPNPLDSPDRGSYSSSAHSYL
jgi:hypothetical protein